MTDPDSSGAANGHGSFWLLSASVVLLLLAWELGVWLLRPPVYILPPPSQVGAELLVRGREFQFLRHVWATLAAVFAGFGIAVVSGVLLAVIVERSPWLSLLLRPYIVAFQVTPKVAIAPLLIVWFGFGLMSKVLIVAAISFFPIFVNTLTGLGALSVKMRDLMRVLSASRWQIFWKAQLPNAMPYFFAGLEVGLLLALLAAVVAEFIGSSQGLGYLLLTLQNQLETAGVFAIIAVFVAIGLCFHFALQAVRRVVVFWAGHV